jgi:hypothetical protein
MRHLHNDLRRDWRKWTRTERFSAVIILTAMITVIVPAAVEFSRQNATAVHHGALTPTR